MKQYSSIKARYPDTILFFRMGDFFETFGDDAVVTAKVCGIILTKRNNGAAGDIELAGFPHHQLDNYLPKMIRAGHRVAVCEQLEDPKLAKGIVKRDVVEVVTPGVQLSEKILDANTSTYVAAVVTNGTKTGFAFADISTGDFSAGEVHTADLANLISSLNIRELLVARTEAKRIEMEPFYLALERKPTLTKRDDWIFAPETARNLLIDHFKTPSLKGFGIDDSSSAVTAAGVVLDYIRETRAATSLQHITRIKQFDNSGYLILDHSTRRNLELFTPLTGTSQEASLITLLDETSTPMGARLLRYWLVCPLKDKIRIERRLDAISTLRSHRSTSERLRMLLKETGDIERLAGRFASARLLSPRDFLTLKFSLWKIPDIKECLSEIAADDSILGHIAHELAPLDELAELIDRTIHPEAPANPASLGIIRDGANSELDDLRSLTSSSRKRLIEIQTRERERTGIGSLKVDFNNVFGYYIEVSKANKDLVPDDYERRQTLTNAERYITPELKEYEQKILGAEVRIAEIEAQLAAELRAKICTYINELQRNASLIAEADVLLGLSIASVKRDWTRPNFTDDNRFEIIDGRHPVVEALLPPGERFTPNSVSFQQDESEFFIITGPNMSGKSVYLRQTGIIALMAHIGSFVPARDCTLHIMDRIFTRVGASDDLAGGESTFLVEMNEAANIINNATRDSLLLFDELGRGTSTFDGLSIAWAVSEYIHDTLQGAKTLFATHYHELNALADRYERIKNLKVEVREADNKVHFLHKITPGYADHSYGIEVAAMAGLPKEIICRAREILRELEETELKIAEADIQRSIPFPDVKPRTVQVEVHHPSLEVIEALKRLDTNSLTPLEALKLLDELRRKALS